MKHDVGLIATLIGILLLIRPDFNISDFLKVGSFFLLRYWPIILIVIGIFLQVNHKAKKRR